MRGSLGDEDTGREGRGNRWKDPRSGGAPRQEEEGRLFKLAEKEDSERKRAAWRLY